MASANYTLSCNFGATTSRRRNEVPRTGEDDPPAPLEEREPPVRLPRVFLCGEGQRDRFAAARRFVRVRLVAFPTENVGTPQEL